MSPNRAGTCVVCGRSSQLTPLIRLDYRGSVFWICPQDLPILIHDPARLADRLPGADTLSPSNHED